MFLFKLSPMQIRLWHCSVDMQNTVHYQPLCSTCWMFVAIHYYHLMKCYFVPNQLSVRRYIFRGWCDSFRRYFEEGDVLLWRGRCATLRRVVCYFEEGGEVYFVVFNVSKMSSSVFMIVIFVLCMFRIQIGILISNIWNAIF